MELSRRHILTGLAAVSLTGCRSDGEPRVAVADGRVLDVPFKAQEKMLCVPTSASMVLAFYGEQQPPRRLKALSRRKDYTEGEAFDDFTVTNFEDLITGLHGLGYYWEEKVYADTPAGFQKGLALIEAEVAAGRPVLANTSIPQGHTIVIRGVDRRNRLLFVTDPSMPAPGHGYVSYDAFQPVWNEHHKRSPIRALITTRPKIA